MSSIYVFSLPPVHGTRLEIMARLSPRLKLVPVRFTGTAYELARDPGLGVYYYSRGEARAPGVDDCLVAGEKWAGIALHYELNYGSMALLLWNDDRPTVTTPALAENSSVFAEQNEDARVCDLFQKFWVCAAEALGAPYGVLRREPGLASLAGDQMREILTQLDGDEEPPLLVLLDAADPAYGKASLGKDYETKLIRGYRVFARKGFGQGGE